MLLLACRCPLCRYDAKHFLNLSSHFLAKHDVLQEWIRERLEEMTEQKMRDEKEGAAAAVGVKREGGQLGSAEGSGGRREVDEEMDTVCPT